MALRATWLRNARCEDVEGDVRLIADRPAVVSGRDVEEVASPHHHFASVVHLGHGLTAQYEARLAQPGTTSHQSPSRRAQTTSNQARLVCCAAERGGPDLVELELALLKRPHLARVIEIHQLEVHYDRQYFTPARVLPHLVDEASAHAIAERVRSLPSAQRGASTWCEMLVMPLTVAATRRRFGRLFALLGHGAR